MIDNPGLREVIDRGQIAEVLYGYCRELDLFRPDAVAALFTEDATADFGPGLGGPLQGREALTAFFAGMAAFSATSHHLSNVVIEFDDPDTARSVAYLYAWHSFPGDLPDAHLYARYHDRLVRTTDGWRIADRVLRAAGARGFEPMGFPAEAGPVWHGIGRAGSVTAAGTATGPS